MGARAVRGAGRVDLESGNRIGEMNGGLLRWESVARLSTISVLVGQERGAG